MVISKPKDGHIKGLQQELDATKEEIQQLKAITISNLEAIITIQDELYVWKKKTN